MLGDMKPFRMAGNLYFVGTYAASSHMIDTGDGLILLDAGYEETADVIVESVTALGFDIKDVKLILLSHGHTDHSGGVPKLAALTGAKTFMNEADLTLIKGFVPDVYIHDGDIIRLGNTEILCLETPGHTAGTVSFFFDVEEDGKVYRAGMFGGAGTNQLKKAYMDKRNLCYLMRGAFFRSLERLKKEHVDLFVGNHAWHNQTKENYEKSLTSKENPFIDATRWGNFLDDCEKNLETVIQNEIKEEFVNYAHRGASEYLPENTLLAFNTGVFMGANGIETDVQLTKDGVAVLFHDNTLERVTGEPGAVSDYTYEELRGFFVRKNEFYDKIVKLDDFFAQFYFRDMTFAIELKGPGMEKPVADLVTKYGMGQKVVITSFRMDYIRKIKEYVPELRVGLLTGEVTDEIIAELKRIRADELCPQATILSPEKVYGWHREGFRVRAWGVSDETLMKKAYDCQVDGMTVDFPDVLTAYIKENR